MPRFHRNLLTVYAAHGFNGVVSVLAVPLALKFLGIQGYGLLSIYTLVAGYALLADLGAGKNLLRLLSDDPRPESQVRNIRVALGLYVLICAAWLAMTPVLAIAVPRYLFPVPPEYVTALRWMVVLAVSEFVLGVPASFMQTACVAAQRFDSYARYSFATGLTRNSILLGAAVVSGSPAVVAVALAGRKLLDLWIAGKVLGWLPRGAMRPVFDPRGLKIMLGQSATLSAALVLNATLMGAGSLLVNAAFGLRGLGLYRSAFDLAGKIAFVSNGITLVVFPQAARRFANVSGMRYMGRRLGDALRCSSVLYQSFAASAIVAAPWILPAIGLRDPTTVRLFILLVAGLSMNAHSLLANELIQAAGRYRYSIYFNACAVATLVALYLAAKPAAGMMAIGWAWVGASLLSACIADGLLLGLCDAARSGQLAAVLVKTVATGACLGLAPRYSSGTDLTIAVLCGGTLLLLLGSTVRVVLRLRSGGYGPDAMENSMTPAVCA